VRLLLVASSGGHFRALLQLEPFWGLHRRTWVTFATPTTGQELAGENDVVWAHSPTNRNLPNLLRNAVLAFRLLRRRRPDVILTTGAGVAVPFLILGRLMGIRTVFIESITRTETLSLSARLALPFLDVLYVHWPRLQIRYPMAELVVPERAA
jgi:UDP-N-acetylglucosamine:LPS N-acetylglucosamine transferase